MGFILFVLVLGGAYAISVFGFCQIVGSFQNYARRGLDLTLFTVILWGVILVAVAFAVHHWVPTQRIVYYIGTALGLLSTLRAGKIE